MPTAAHDAPPGQLATFRARFYARRKAFVTVRIFDTLDALRAYAATHDMTSSIGRNYWALSVTWTRHRPTRYGFRLTPDHGEILLCRSHLGVGLLSHECTHSTFGWAERQRLQPARVAGHSVVPADEEDFCRALGGLLSAVVRGLQRHRLLLRG